jgi:fibrillarin-like pre-rRNA processing protein
MSRFRAHPKYDGVYTSGVKENLRFYTINLDRDRTVYNEKLFMDGEIQYREWNPYRSKLCSAMKCNIRKTYLEKNTRLLYLGASSGTTVSHCSDILTGPQGVIYAVEFSPRSLRELVQNCVDRKNVVPILGDANQPQSYAKFVIGQIDVIYQDVAQPNQAEILIKNARHFLKKHDGAFLYAVKARSIDTAGKPQQIFREEIDQLQQAGLQVLDSVDISAYQSDHILLCGRYDG